MIDDAPGRRCLDCGALLDAQAGGCAPRDGDVSICLYCGCIAFYAANMQRLRRPTPAEEMQLATDPQIQRAVIAARIVRSQMRSTL